MDSPPSSMGAPYAITMEFSNWHRAALSGAPMKNVCRRDELRDPVSNRCVKCGCPADVCLKRDDCHWTRVTNDNVHVREDSFLVINSSSEELEPDFWHRDGPNAVMACVSTTDDATALRPVEFEDVLSTILLLISVVCLILHVIAYALLPKLRTGPARLVLSLAFSVLVAQGSFVAGGLLLTPGSVVCRVCSVVSHGAHLAAFFWMNVIAIDVHLTFCKGISGSSRAVRAFPAYSAYAWLAPTLLVAAASTLEYVLPESPWSPSYGSPHCWINRPLSLIAFFGAPLLLLLLSNTVFFLLTARSIHHTSKQAKLARSTCAGPSNEQRRLTLYAKLAGVLGLTWAFGFAASLTGLNAFWYPFIVLCGLQGAFIFLAFTFKRSVYRMASSLIAFMASSGR
ncbi:putative G-protein coupled receptor Mth-like 4 [Haemaphysalis longicornis]